MKKEKGNNPKILVVDDEEPIRRLMEAILLPLYYEVIFARDGMEALDKVREIPPDVILLDVKMPKMNGFEVARRLKTDEATKIIPIVMVTALSGVEDRVKAIEAGADDFLNKPVDKMELRARVSSLLKVKAYNDHMLNYQKELEAEVARRTEQLLAHQRVAQELALAWQIQESFLPSELPSVAGWELSATLKPARETSGDFYDVLHLPNGRLGILIADVADKGIGAALYMALSRTLIRTYAFEYDSQPEIVLSATNRRLLMDVKTSMFVTVFYGILDLATGTLTYCNAGHNPPCLLRAQNGGAVQVLPKTGMALGVTEDVDWKQETVQLALGDVLLLYTDGITEAQNLREEFFGEKRLLEIMQANRGCSPQDTIDALIAEVLKFAGNAPQFDDITLMVVVRALPKNVTMKGKVTKGNQLELTVKAKLENLAVIGNFITDAMKQFGIEQETFPVELAVDEACTNIIQHAYSGESEKSIRILFSVSGNDLVIKIRDWGKPFDPDSVPPPDRESELFERKLGGLGVFLIRQMMDEIRYVFYPGRYNELTMTKYLPQKN